MTISATEPIRGKRYNVEQKEEIIRFVNDHNAQNGRGGQTAAVKKYGVSQITISNWLTNSSSSSLSIDNELNSKMKSMLKLSKKIQKADEQLNSLRAEYAKIKASL